MGLVENLFEAAFNIAAAAVNTVKAMPEGLNNACASYMRERISEIAAVMKKSDEKRFGQTAPNWFYIETSKKLLVSDYRIPENLKSDYQRYSSTFGTITWYDPERDYRIPDNLKFDCLRRSSTFGRITRHDSDRDNSW